jgi:hypothetical protein
VRRWATPWRLSRFRHVAEHSRASARVVGGSGVRHTSQARASGLASASLPANSNRAGRSADHAKADQVRMARDVATMFDELKALADRHAELHAGRARLQAKLERARAELTRARRPWWRRLVGR